MTKSKGPHLHYIVVRYASDWTRGVTMETIGSRVAAKRIAAALRLSMSQLGIVMVLRDDQLRDAAKHGFTVYDRE